MKSLIQLAGERFGKLYVVSRACNSKSNHAQWNCICDCGNGCIVRGVQLTRGRSKSCGCLRVEVPKVVNRIHGYAPRGKQDRTYIIWVSMKLRCNSGKEQNYKYYGGRGITYNSDWESYTGFLLDMGECPKGYSLERIDVNGNYEKQNCKWIPKNEQMWNKRNSKMVCFNGETKSFPVWVNELGLNYNRVYRRLLLGWSVDEAFLTPMR